MKKFGFGIRRRKSPEGLCGRNVSPEEAERNGVGNHFKTEKIVGVRDTAVKSCPVLPSLPLPCDPSES